jgi:multidrug efflux pump
MVLSDFSIKRPVVATVASLLLIVFGLFAISQMAIRETPDIERPIVSVRVVYPGASADVIETRVVKVIEDQISGIEGIKTVSATARDAMGWLTLEFELGHDLDTAANDVREQVARTLSRLPPDAEPPVVQKADQDAEPVMWMNVYSTSMSTIRLGEIANVEIGPESENSSFKVDGNPSVGLGIVKRPGASTLTVAREVRAKLDDMRVNLPPGMEFAISMDSSVFIEEALREVGFTMGLAAVLVLVVIYLFLGTVRAAIIPAVTVPISLIGTFLVLWPLGFSINILTLLALVLAIGLVVDDAIIVLENVHRRMKRGEPALLAAFRGTRQVGVAVVATTLVLIAAFVPITLQTGTTGRLFTEFAVTMAAAVAFSMFTALTLTPVMCSKILTNELDDSLVARGAIAAFEKMKAFYRKTLIIGLDHPAAVMIGFVLIVASSAVMYTTLPKEFTPVEDRGSLALMIRAPEGSSLEYTDRQAALATEILRPYLGQGEVTRLLQMLPMGEAASGAATNTGHVMLRLETWHNRDRTAKEIQAELAPKLRQIPGAQMMLNMPGGMGMMGWGNGLNLTIGGTTYEELREWRDIVMNTLRENPRLFAVRSNFNETKAQMRINIDRTRAADLGVSISTIGQTLAVMMGSRKVTTFIERGEEYNVMLQGQLNDRRTPSDVSNIYVRSDTTRELIPLSSLITIEEFAGPDSLNRLDRMRSISVFANPAPGYLLGEVIRDVEQAVFPKLPPQARLTWRGEAEEFLDSNAMMVLAFSMSLLVVFLVLAAQFESFVHPFVILMTVPLAVVGALAGLHISGNSFSLYSQIGIIVLVGLAAKNGILIVEFANQLRDAGMSFRDALIEASTIRLRPIVMTALATVTGALPLVFASGAGAEGRQAIGVVIAAGVAFASFITLLVVPVFYQLLAKNTGSPGRVSSRLHEQEVAFPAKRFGSGEEHEGPQPAE